MNQVEEEAKSRGCTLAHVETYDFQAKDFYLKQGYEIFGVLDECPPRHKRYFLKKILVSKKITSVKIRRAIDSDISQLEELFLSARQQAFRWEDPLKFKRTDYLISTEGEAVFVAELKEKIIGFISIWEKDTHPFIHHLFIAPHYQRRGVGTLLINSLFDRLPRPYRLKCIARNQIALNFYLKNKWIEIEKGVGEDGEYFLLELPA